MEETLRTILENQILIMEALEEIIMEQRGCTYCSQKLRDRRTHLQSQSRERPGVDFTILKPLITNVGS